MKPHLREILTDLKAAVRIGHMDTVQSALDGIRALDSNSFPPTALKPIGAALTSIQSEDLRPLLSDPDPAIRGIAAVALAQQYVMGKGATPEDLRGPANDRSPEVRSVVLETLTQTGGDDRTPERLLALSEDWLASENTNLIQSGLGLLPFTNLGTDELISILKPMHLYPNYDVRKELVRALSILAEKGHAAAILSMLKDWAEQDDPNVWVITKALSSSWAITHSQAALALLNALADKVGSIRSIARAIARLETPS